MKTIERPAPTEYELFYSNLGKRQAVWVRVMYAAVAVLLLAIGIYLRS